MKKEDRELLMQEICARIPYRTWFKFSYEDPYGRKSYSKSIIEGVSFPYYIEHFTLTGKERLHIETSEIQLYLFPMSSMTEEQEREYLNTCNGYCTYYWTDETFDWLNENHFDYKHLIEKGLAIDATN